jgi:hypothetical protein
MKDRRNVDDRGMEEGCFRGGFCAGHVILGALLLKSASVHGDLGKGAHT